MPDLVPYLVPDLIISKSFARVPASLDAAGVGATVLEIPGGIRIALDAANAAGCRLDQIAKSIIIRWETSGHIRLFLTAGGNRVCPLEAGSLVGEALGKADGDLIRAQTGFSIGGVAPIGHLRPGPCRIDPRLLEFATVWAAAGTPRHIFQIASDILQRMCGTITADFAA